MESRSIDDMVSLIRPALMKELSKMIERLKYVKIQSKMKINLERQRADENGNLKKEVKEYPLLSKSRIVSKSSLDNKLTNQVAELKHVFDMVGDRIEGSNWKLKNYINLTVEVFKIRPTRGSSYIPTPTRFSNAKCG